VTYIELPLKERKGKERKGRKKGQMGTTMLMTAMVPERKGDDDDGDEEEEEEEEKEEEEAEEEEEEDEDDDGDGDDGDDGAEEEEDDNAYLSLRAWAAALLGAGSAAPRPMIRKMINGSNSSPPITCCVGGVDDGSASSGVKMGIMAEGFDPLAVALALEGSLLKGICSGFCNQEDVSRSRLGAAARLRLDARAAKLSRDLPA
jgi:hypothetical protein